MVYTGQSYAIRLDTDAVLALPPLVVDAVCSTPMSPGSDASVQFSIVTDVELVDYCFFLNEKAPPGQGQVADGQIGFGLGAGNVQPVYAQNPTSNVIATTYQAITSAAGGNLGISDYNSKPLQMADFLAGNITLELELLFQRLYVRAFDTNTKAQLWTGGAPNTILGLPKGIQVELVGPPVGGTINYTAGNFRTTYTATKTTVQTGPDAGTTISAQRIKPVPLVTYTDPGTGNIFSWQTETGESSNLNAVATDLGAGLQWQLDASPGG